MDPASTEIEIISPTGLGPADLQDYANPPSTKRELKRPGHQADGAARNGGARRYAAGRH